MAGAASQAGDTDSSQAPGLTSGVQGSLNVHRGALLLMPQWQCISSFAFCILTFAITFEPLHTLQEGFPYFTCTFPVVWPLNYISENLKNKTLFEGNDCTWPCFLDCHLWSTYLKTLITFAINLTITGRAFIFWLWPLTYIYVNLNICHSLW